MVVYELTHMFYYQTGDFVLSPKHLGFFESYAKTRAVVEEYKETPGFCENTKGFSLRRRVVEGDIRDKIIYEVLVHVYSQDSDFEFEVELGLYGEETLAKKTLDIYCAENQELLGSHQFVVEKIINRCIINKKEWIDGFSFDEDC